MATYTQFKKTSVQKLGTEVVKAEVEIDFSAQNVVVSDIVEALVLPAGAVIISALAHVKTAEGGAATVDVGISGGSATALDSNLDANSAGIQAMATQNYINDSGDEETVIVTADGTIATAVVQLILIYAVSELTLS